MSYFTSATELKDHLDSTIVLDIRAPDAYKAEHIPGSHNIHDCFTYLATSSDEGTKELQSKFRSLFESVGITGKAGEKVVTYEDGLTTCFAMSCRAAFLLRYLGHPNANVLDGGLQAWKAKGFAVTTDVPKAVPATFEAKVDESYICDKNAVLDAIKNKNRVLLDCRDKDEWIGTSSSPYGIDFAPRKGRFPGAVWLEWYKLMEDRDKDGVVYAKRPEEVLKIAEGVGIKPEDNIIIYCFKGSRVSNTMFLLRHAGFNKTVNYFASWNEWSRDPSLPIDDKVLAS